jgi:hypothetical protein
MVHLAQSGPLAGRLTRPWKTAFPGGFPVDDPVESFPLIVPPAAVGAGPLPKSQDHAR